jgi:hypothetical protein
MSKSLELEGTATPLSVCPVDLKAYPVVAVFALQQFGFGTFRAHNLLTRYPFVIYDDAARMVPFLCRFYLILHNFRANLKYYYSHYK